MGDRGRAGETQPNLGLDKLFGARETYVEFTPDLLEDLTMTVQGRRVPGRFFLQRYELAGGRSAGAYWAGNRSGWPVARSQFEWAPATGR